MTAFNVTNIDGFTADEIAVLNELALRIRAELVAAGFSGGDYELAQAANEKALRQYEPSGLEEYEQRRLERQRRAR